MIEFTAKSGAKIVITEADWPDAKRLKMAIQNELAHTGVSLSLDADVSGLVSAFMRVDSAKAVDDALWPCLARCTRNGDKINESMFNTDLKAREDYYEIVIACVKANLLPLFASLYSWWKSLIKAQPDLVKSPS